VEAQALRVSLPARLSAPNLPELNFSQVSAVQSVLQAPLSLIQGAPCSSHTQYARPQSCRQIEALMAVTGAFDWVPLAIATSKSYRDRQRTLTINVEH
jgi:hypothetical protein